MTWKDIVDRQTGILNFSSELNLALSQARIASFGGGGNGTVIDVLARTGFQDFDVVDFDVVEPSNLNRLPFLPEAVGRPKVEVWKDYLTQLNPAIKVRPHNRRFDRNDEGFVRSIVEPADVVALGVTDLEAIFLVARVCADLEKPMVVGPGTANCWVVSTVTNRDGRSIEAVGRFGTEGTDPRDIDYRALAPKFQQLYLFPGREERLEPAAFGQVKRGEIAPRSAKIFVTLANAAAAWEIVKNVALMNDLPLENTSITEFPILQIFDPFRGASFYWNAETGAFGIPNWLDGEISWRQAPRRGR